MRHVIVTGASGFLGRAVMKALADRGIDVLGVSRTQSAGIQRVAGYEKTPQGRVLVHLAEDPVRSQVNARGEAYLKQSVSTISDLLGKGYEQVIYASSSIVYGDRNQTPNSVGTPALSSDVYCRNKLACESMVLGYGGIVVRLANLIGPGMSSANVVSEVLQQLSTPGPVRIRNGDPVRDFLWVEDAGEAIARLIDKPSAGVYNLGSGRGISILELARLLLDAAGQPDREIEHTGPGGPISVNVLDISETTARLDWTPRTSIRDGLARLVKSIKITAG